MYMFRCVTLRGSLRSRALASAAAPRRTQFARPPPWRHGSAAQQLACVRTVEKQLAAFPKGTELVVSHGNGPQVGQILLQSDLTADKFPPTPIDSAVAATIETARSHMSHINLNASVAG